MPLAIEHDYDFIDAMEEDARCATTPPSIIIRRRVEAQKARQATERVIADFRKVWAVSSAFNKAQDAYLKLNQVYSQADLDERKALEPDLYAALERLGKARVRLNSTKGVA